MSPFDNINELAGGYIEQPASSMRAKEGYWKTAFGLQAVDGLVPSEYARQLATAHMHNELPIAAVTSELNRYYAGDARNGDISGRTEEADKVSARIVELLDARPFSLDAALLPYIHCTLFQDLDPTVYHPGEFRNESLVKLEPVLNADTLLYCAPALIARSLEVLFAKEQAYRYSSYSDGSAALCHADLRHLAEFISDVWYTHPFWEGNTRTVAVFCELYLNHLGFDVNNEPFDAHAAFFRNALVRANYRNRKAGVDVDFTHLVDFMADVVEDAGIPLNDADPYCVPLFEHPELVRNIDAAFAAALQAELKGMGIAEAVLRAKRGE